MLYNQRLRETLSGFALYDYDVDPGTVWYFYCYPDMCGGFTGSTWIPHLIYQPFDAAY